MTVKAEWTTYLHNLRRREMNVIFKRCPPKVFSKIPEPGAGDGFVYVNNLIYKRRRRCSID